MRWWSLSLDVYKRQLQNGAVKVYAVDVGNGQLAWKLRQDERVVCMEKTNIRYVTCLLYTSRCV